MNRIFSFLFFVFCTVATPMVAQNSTTEATLSPSAARYGSVSRSAILAQLPEIKHAHTA